MIITGIEEWLQAICVCAFKVHIGIVSVSEVCSNHHVDIEKFIHKNSRIKSSQGRRNEGITPQIYVVVYTPLSFARVLNSHLRIVALLGYLFLMHTQWFHKEMSREAVQIPSMDAK